MFDVLVLGSGVAGLTAALTAARSGRSVLVLTKTELANTATRYAQGGVAAAFEAPDSPELHLTDTLLAGAGLCDADAVAVLVREGPQRVRDLAATGARFDETGRNGEWRLAREGGHTLARVVHAGGDATGAEIERALVAAAQRGEVEIRERWTALDLLIEYGRCAGVLALDPDGHAVNVRATDTILATGGAGQCFAVTTNPLLSTGDGVALALRAGAACADLEFEQFHPTAMHVASMPRPLLSEALRGEGAVLRDDHGTPFMVGVHEMADLAPRDVVSLAIARQLAATGAEHVWLDATMIGDFARRFPTIAAACVANDLDPAIDWLPVAPAAHYTCGGVVTDLDGATTIPHLWACGETACSGVHGANRLASNSLLDGLVFGHRVLDALGAGKSEPDPTGAMRGVLEVAGLGAPVSDPALLPQPDPVAPAALRSAVQRVMTNDVGVVRTRSALETAVSTLRDLVTVVPALPARDPSTYEAMNLLRVARAIAASALAREESRGCHTRDDFPKVSKRHLGRNVVVGEHDPVFVPFEVAKGKSRR